MNLIILLLLITIILIKILIALSDNRLCDNFQSLCYEQQTCENCIRIHHCCNWCYEKGFSGFRCFTENNTNCNKDFIIDNSKSEVTELVDKKFSDVVDVNDMGNVIQIRPQVLEIKLRKDEPINFTIQYKAAKNFPLDLYYLMDLTYSMRKDLDTIRQLGKKLSESLQKLTNNYKMAFGSYVDKTDMPFYLTDDTNSENPCLLLGIKCERGYLFKHKLNFTKDIQLFIDKVQESQLSANVDNLEGGLDALMQILLCEKQLEWSENSRKLVIVATESTMHLAGDGILLGAVKQNIRKCLINAKGNYMNPLKYDYPSLEEVHRQLQKRKINTIFAVKENSLDYYHFLHKILPESTFIGKLEEDSTNILELVKEGYYDFIKRVTFTTNTSHIKELDVEFFADCYGNGFYNKTNTCYNVEEGKLVNFIVQFTLNEYPNNSSHVIYLEERNIQEFVTLNLNYLDTKCTQCKLETTAKTCVNGNYICGNCSCFDGWTGDTCEQECDTAISLCRKEENDTISTTCFGNGDCICGKCQCSFPFTGKYCEYECPFDKYTKLICGGKLHGACIEGKCVCDQLYTGADCSCSLSEEKCKVPGKSDVMCNDHGECKCNKCQCEHGYSGEFCQICSDCEGLCNLYLNCVTEKIHNDSNTCLLDDAVVSSKIVEDFNPSEIGEICYYRYTKGEETCSAQYTYTLRKGGYVNINIKKSECTKPLETASMVGIILGAILGLGIIGILAYKFRNMYQDKKEYQRFKQETLEQSFKREDNPLYKSPIVTYNNPMEMTTVQRNII